MNDHLALPVFDDQGINLADPNDTLGYKTKYISMVQEKSLSRYLGHAAGQALDIGCGYGRMAGALSSLGYDVTGVEPSERVLKVASELQPQHHWHVGGLPDLPVPKDSFDLVCLFNVARSLHLIGMAEVCSASARYVKPGGRLVVIDNLRKDDDRYLPEKWFESAFAKDGLQLVLKKPIRASRWPIIYVIRYGLIPQALLSRIANWELNRMEKKKRVPRFSYHNYMFVFEKQ